LIEQQTLEQYTNKKAIFESITKMAMIVLNIALNNYSLLIILADTIEYDIHVTISLRLHKNV